MIARCSPVTRTHCPISDPLALALRCIAHSATRTTNDSMSRDAVVLRPQGAAKTLGGTQKGTAGGTGVKVSVLLVKKTHTIEPRLFRQQSSWWWDAAKTLEGTREGTEGGTGVKVR